MKRALIVALTICTLGALGWGLQVMLALRESMAPTRPTTYIQAGWSVYRFGPGHAAHVGRENLDCTACHRSTGEGKFDRPGPGACVDCHDAQAAIDHALVNVDESGHRVKRDTTDRELSDCMRCHGFGPDPEQRPTDCLSCHARAQGSEPPVELHATEACTSCHDVHDNRVTPLACQQCHPMSVDHGAHAAGDPAQCLDCHRAHAPASAALTRCRDCHGTSGERAVPETATGQGHSCTGCHAPHSFSKAEVASCESCHTEQHVLDGRGHGECTSCHTPHAVRASVSEQNVCVQCHADVALTHDKAVDPVAACTGCHAPHPEKGKASPAECTSCHDDIARSDVTAHAKGVECTSCHTPHAFAQTQQAGHGGVDQSACVSCHGPRVKLLAPHKGHAACISCHTALPHGGVPQPIDCSSCHKEQAKATHAGSATGHTTCLNCHDAHTGARIKQCADCHSEQASHLSVKHGPCQSCHESHSGTFLPGVADCSSCHTKAKLTGLHQVPEHVKSCTNCHGVHATEKAAAPAQCLACHTEQKDHEPTATRCDGCHAFRPAPKGKAP